MMHSKDMRTLSIKVADALLLQASEDDLARQSRFFLALKFFELGRLTSSQAAEMCGMNRDDFIATANSDGTSMPGLNEKKISLELGNSSKDRSQESTLNYRVVIESDKDGIFVAVCPALPGCVSKGKTRAEALANIKTSMTSYLANLKKHDEPEPSPTSKKSVEIRA
jgi:antitoxin HicB